MRKGAFILNFYFYISVSLAVTVVRYIFFFCFTLGQTKLQLYFEHWAEYVAIVVRNMFGCRLNEEWIWKYNTNTKKNCINDRLYKIRQIVNWQCGHGTYWVTIN
jgi:hypothetical protein